MDQLQPWLVGLLLIPLGVRLFLGMPPSIALWFSCVLPVVALSLRLLRTSTFVIGSGFIWVIHGVESTPWEWTPLLCYELLLAVGMWLLCTIPIDSCELLDNRRHPEDELNAKLERELARARRYERPLLLLVSESEEASNVPIVGTEELRLLQQLISDSLRIYAEVLVVEGRIYALVPEVETTVLALLLQRIQSAVSGAGFAVQVGAAHYPTDALCSEDLLRIAKDRLHPITQPATPPRIPTASIDEMAASE
ncbi:MAG: hypothetical protein AAFY29_17320 [Pseudomonadota bacterium]